MIKFVLQRRIRQLTSNNPYTRTLAAKRLGAAPDVRAVGPLIEALQDFKTDRSGGFEFRYQEMEQVRCEVAAALGRTRDARGVVPLLELLDDWRPGVRCVAIRALATIGDRRAEGPFVTTLTTSAVPWIVRVEAARALDSLGWAPIDGSSRAIQALLLNRWEDVQSLGTLAVPALLEAEVRAPRGWSEFGKTSKALLTLGSAAVDPLIHALLGDDLLVRAPAARVLSQIADRRAIEPLIHVLRTRSAILWEPSHSWGMVIQALRSFGDRRAIEPLVEVLGDSSWSMRGAAAEVLLSLGWQPRDESEASLVAIAMQRWPDVIALGAAAIDPISDALSSEYHHWFPDAVASLRTIGGPRLVSVLVQALAKPVLRWLALDALIEVGDVQAVLPLFELSRSDNYATLPVSSRPHRSRDHHRTVYELVMKTVGTLAAILRRDVAHVTSECLRLIAGCDDVTLCLITREYHADETNEPWYSEHESEAVVDCSNIRELASQELATRP
jgi:HEAT repeat protein